VIFDVISKTGEMVKFVAVYGEDFIAGLEPRPGSRTVRGNFRYDRRLRGRDLDLPQALPLPNLRRFFHRRRIDGDSLSVANHLHLDSSPFAPHHPPGNTVSHAAKFAYGLAVHGNNAITRAKTCFVRRPPLLNVADGGGRFRLADGPTYSHDDHRERQGQQKTEQRPCKCHNDLIQSGNLG